MCHRWAIAVGCYCCCSPPVKLYKTTVDFNFSISVMHARAGNIPSHQRHWIRWKMNPIQMDSLPIAAKCLRNHCTKDLRNSNRMSCRQSLDLADRNRSPQQHPIQMNISIQNYCVEERAVTDVPCNWSKWHTCKQAEISTSRPSLSGHQSSASSMNGIPATMAVPPRCEVAANASVSIFAYALRKKWVKKWKLAKRDRKRHTWIVRSLVVHFVHEFVAFGVLLKVLSLLVCFRFCLLVFRIE